MNAASIYDTLAHGSIADRVALLDTLPSDEVKNQVRPLLASDIPGMPVVAFGMLSMKYANGSNPEAGAALASALHQYGVELLLSGRQGQFNYLR